MTNIVSRINLYDVLAMIVPGSIFLWGLKLCAKSYQWNSIYAWIKPLNVTSGTIDQIVYSLLLLALAYAVGLIIQEIVRWFWKIPCLKKITPGFAHCYINQINEERPHLMVLKAEINKNIKAEECLPTFYETYNKAIFFNPHTAILTIEKQIAMLRNLIIAILPLCLTLTTQWYWKLLVWLGMAIVLFAVILLRMHKVVELVFEEYEAVKQSCLDDKK